MLVISGETLTFAAENRKRDRHMKSLFNAYYYFYFYFSHE